MIEVLPNVFAILEFPEDQFSVDGWFAHTVQSYREIFLLDGQLRQIALLAMGVRTDKGPRVLILAVPIEAFAGREDARMALEVLKQSSDVRAYIFAAEAWAVPNVSPEDAGRVAPSEHPDRREVLMFAMETRAKSRAIWVGIERDADGLPILGEDEVQPEALMISGMFGGLLYQAPMAQVAEA